MTNPPVARKLAVGHLCVRPTASFLELAVGHLCVRSTASFLATGGFKFYLFQNACMVYKHAVVGAFRIYAQRGEVAAKRVGWSLCIK